jgi:hypothetical protein
MKKAGFRRRSAAARCLPRVPFEPAEAASWTRSRQRRPGGSGEAATYEARTGRTGTRFVYLKGGLSRLAFRVESTEGGVHKLADEQGTMVLRVGEDLSDRGQEKPGDKRDDHVRPRGLRALRPLWQGKRWTCNFTSRSPARPDIPLLVSYTCDATEDVTVPAGTFRCLRVWRRARLAVEGNWIDRISVAWYAPDAGAFVRRLSTAS